MSPSLKRVVSTFNWKDSYRCLHPNEKSFSRYYSTDRFSEGASRIDRSYHWGDLVTEEAKYISIAFSDHLAMTVSYCLPDPVTRAFTPRSRPQFRVKPDVVVDPIFQARLRESMTEWEQVLKYGVSIVKWVGESV